ncbi:hypothetical protein BY996DRAFT_7038792 [Phakopsora pachyrhizi]|nr:hypothetical protein BY996DRAFT_7038792 [Phakopsora pachyrhizi]
MSNHSFSPVIDSKCDNLNSEYANDQGNFSNGSIENLDPELERFECLQKINVEYSIHVPAIGGIQTISSQFGPKTNAIQPCIHFCNKGACYEAELPLNAIGWNQFKFLLYESANSSESRLHEVIRTVEDVYITGYVSNDPELRKNRRFVLKNIETFEKWRLSVAKHPKAEIGAKILTPNPKERLENQKKIDLVRSMESITSELLSGSSLSQSSMMIGNTTEARIKALMAQLVKEYPINNKYSKEASVYINTANPKEYIHITYEMRKKWARMILEEVPTVTISRPPFLGLFWDQKKKNDNDNRVDWVQPYGQPVGFPYGSIAYSVPPWITQPAIPFGLGNKITQQQPRIPSPELPPQVGDYSFERFLEFAGLDHLETFERNHLHNNGLDNIKVLLSKHTTYDRLINMSLDHGVVTQLLNGAVSWKKKNLKDMSI